MKEKATGPAKVGAFDYVKVEIKFRGILAAWHRNSSEVCTVMLGLIIKQCEEPTQF